MKITVKQLKELIRESVEETIAEQGYITEPGLSDPEYTNATPFGAPPPAAPAREPSVPGAERMISRQVSQIASRQVRNARDISNFLAKVIREKKASVSVAQKLTRFARDWGRYSSRAISGIKTLNIGGFVHPNAPAPLTPEEAAQSVTQQVQAQLARVPHQLTMDDMPTAPAVGTPSAPRAGLRGGQLEEQAAAQPLTAPLSASVLRSLQGLKLQLDRDAPIARADADAIERIYYAYVREQRAARQAARTAQQTARNVNAAQARTPSSAATAGITRGGTAAEAPASLGEPGQMAPLPVPGNLEESITQSIMEAIKKLSKKQKKLDKNKNGKLDAEDFKMLRQSKKAKPAKK